MLHQACSISPPRLVLPDSIDTIDELEPYLQRAVEEAKPPGISVAVVNNEGTLYSKSFGYADPLLKKMATADTVYQWWSLTKLFTAVAVMQLQEDGLIDISDPVAQHLPYFKVKNGDGSSQSLTIEQLLSHSSGLGDIGISILGWIHYEDDPHISQTTLLKRELPNYDELKTSPGEEGRYSNLGYLVLAGLIEEVSGRSYETYIIEEILLPLGMVSTNFIYTHSMAPVEAMGSHPRDLFSFIASFLIDMDRAVKERSNSILWFNRVYSDQKGATGLIGSANDITKFMRAILNKGELDGVRILSEESIEQMQRPIIAISDSPIPSDEEFKFALSWFVGAENGERVLSHGGGGMAFVTMLKLFPDSGIGIVVIANSTYLGRDMGSGIVDLIGELEF